MATNIHYHASPLSRAERSVLRHQQGLTIWFTGLSASGKSTIAIALEQHLLHLGLAAYRLDGDNVRFGLNKDLGFSEADRGENIRRIGEVSKLFADSATIALTSFISPYRADRQLARDLHAPPPLPPTTNTTSTTSSGGTPAASTVTEPPSSTPPIPFVEVFVDIPLAEAERRDPKGLYRKARAGEIKDFTGLSASAPYEPPLDPEIHIRSDQVSVEEAVAQIVTYLEGRGLLALGGLGKAKGE